jgi:hypothetical protein
LPFLALKKVGIFKFAIFDIGGSISQKIFPLTPPENLCGGYQYIDLSETGFKTCPSRSSPPPPPIEKTATKKCKFFWVAFLKWLK